MSENTIEVESGSLTEAIVRNEHEQVSGEGHGDYNRSAQVREEQAEKDTESNSDAAFHDAFIEAIEDTKPILTDEQRAIREEREAAARERSEEAEAEEEAEQEAQEEQENKEPNPLNQFAPDAVKAFADHYGLTEEELESPAIQRMLASRMSETAANQQAEVEASKTPEQKTAEHYQTHFAQLAQMVSDPQIFDPPVVEATVRGLAQCFGAETPEALGNVQNLSSILGQAAISFASTNVPKLMRYHFAQMVEEFLPGLIETHRSATEHNSWAEVRSSNPNYRDLPDVDSPEFESLKEKIIAENPWIESMIWTDANGRSLSPHHPQAVRQAASLLAKLASGERVTPEMMKQAVETGRQQALSHRRVVTASKALSAGRKGSGKTFQAQPANEFRDAIVAFNRASRSTPRDTEE